MRLILSLMSFLLLTACTPQIVTKTVYKTVYIDREFLTTVPVTRPPEKEEFINLSCEKQRDVLGFYSLDLLKDIKLANKKLNKIENIYTSHLTQVDEMNKSKKD